MSVIDVGESGPAVRVIAGDPTPEELAVVVAVISEQYANEVAGATVDIAPPRDTWSRASRTRRFPRQTWGR